MNQPAKIDTKEKPKPKTKPEKTPEQIAEAKKAKAAKFSEIASGRVTKALKSVSVIGNLTGPAYVFTKEQSEKILGALDDEIETLRTKFELALNRKSGEKEKPTFQV